jgi:hypothetical protein
MKTDTFRSISIVGWKLSSMVSKRNQSLGCGQSCIVSESCSSHSLPRECITCYEASEYIIRSKHAHGAYDEKLDMESDRRWADISHYANLTARAMANTRKLSLSTYLRSSAQWSSSLAIQPIVAPYTMLKMIVYPHVSPNQAPIAVAVLWS